MVDFFKNLYNSSGVVDAGDIADLIQPLISREDNAALCSTPSPVEIRSGVFQLGALKAPGPDGMSAIFFQH